MFNIELQVREIAKYCKILNGDFLSGGDDDDDNDVCIIVIYD